jgi:hypothetical protein
MMLVGTLRAGLGGGGAGRSHDGQRDRGGQELLHGFVSLPAGHRVGDLVQTSRLCAAALEPRLNASQQLRFTLTTPCDRNLSTR